MAELLDPSSLELSESSTLLVNVAEFDAADLVIPSHMLIAHESY